MNQDEVVQVNQEPHHKQRWINSIARVFYLDIKEGDWTLSHQHHKLTCYFCLSDLELRESQAKDSTVLKRNSIMIRDHRQDHLIHKVYVVRPGLMVVVEIQKENGFQQKDSIEGLEALHQQLELTVYKLKNQKMTIRSPSILIMYEDGKVKVDGEVKDLKQGDDLYLDHQGSVLEIEDQGFVVEIN